MAIKIHCEYCGKKIEAPDTAGGKWGKCPDCGNKLYIPKFESDEDDLKLAPIDEEDEKRQKQLIAETCRLEHEILSEKEIPETQGAASVPADRINEKELTKNIIVYLRQMADGDLKAAEQAAKKITAGGSMAVGIINQIALSEIPEPELADIPQQVLAGLIRKLRSRIS